MTIFKSKKLAPAKPVCLRLKEARLERKVSLEELSRRTRVAKKYLTALEECRYEALPEGVYQKHFLRLYTGALGLDVRSFIDQYEDETAVAAPARSPLTAAVSVQSLLNIPGILKTAGVGVLALVLLGYLGWQIKAMVSPPLLELSAPEDGFITNTRSIVVHGRVERESQVTVNGDEVVTAHDGAFEERLDLDEGVNTITVKAMKKHGGEKVVERTVLYEVRSDDASMTSALPPQEARRVAAGTEASGAGPVTPTPVP